MRKFLTLLILTFFFSIAGAEEYPYMVIRMTDGNETVVSSSGLELVVSGDKLLVNSVEGGKEFNIDGLSMLMFSKDMSGIGSVFNEDEEIEVYDLKGVLIGKFNGLKNATRELGKGLYLVKGKSATSKIYIAK